MKVSIIAIMLMLVLIVHGSISKFDKLSIERLKFMLSRFKKIENPVKWLETKADFGYNIKKRLKKYLKKYFGVEDYAFYVYKPIVMNTKIFMVGSIDSYIVEIGQNTINHTYRYVNNRLLSPRPLFYINNENILHCVESFSRNFMDLETNFTNSLDKTSIQIKFKIENAHTPQAYYAPVDTDINPENIFTIDDFVNYEKIKQNQANKFVHFLKFNLLKKYKNTDY